MREGYPEAKRKRIEKLRAELGVSDTVKELDEQLQKLHKPVISLKGQVKERDFEAEIRLIAVLAKLEMNRKIDIRKRAALALIEMAAEA